jgi:hypothetical protein
MREEAYEIALLDPSRAELLGASTKAKLKNQIVVLRADVNLAALRVRISQACGSQTWNGCNFPFACSERTTQEGSEFLAENAFTTRMFYERVSWEFAV